MKHQQIEPFQIIYAAREDSERRRSMLSKKEKFANSSQPKGPSKNKYADKVRQSCGGLSTSLRPPSEMQMAQAAKTDKKSRNKQAARECRERKKQYIDILLQQIKEHQQEIKQTQKEIEQCKNQIIKADQTRHQYVGGQFYTQLGQILGRLKKLLLQEDSIETDTEINLAIDSLCYRYALLGKDRACNIDRGYKFVLKVGITADMRYLMYCADHSFHFFADQNSDKQEDQWVVELQDIMGRLTPEERAAIKDSKEGFLALKGCISKIIQNLVRKREQMMQLCGQIDELHEQTRKIFTPRQFAKWLIFNEKNRYKQFMRYLQNICIEDWQIEFREPKKKCKLNQPAQ